MASPTVPNIVCEQVHAGLTVTDILAATDFYVKKLGFTVSFLWGDPPTFAGVNLGSVQMFLKQGTPSPDGCEVYFMVGDADELHEFHRASGVDIVVAPGDREYGIRDYSVRDLYGYELVFGHRLGFDAGPPLKIEREDVSVRLEKRLAAALRDLAEHKRMSLTSCFEETFLHTFERLGDGVASPHTIADLNYIQKLKEKHGIDYDCHASYRFVE